LFGRLENVEAFLVITHGAEWVKLGVDGPKGAALNKQDCPTQVDALLVHGGDWDTCLPAAKAQLSQGIGTTFIFNATGNPPRKKDTIRILRATQPFDLSERDARQLIQYVQKSSAMLPSCCVATPRTLIALDILCQGYRATHGDSSLAGFEGLSPERNDALQDRSDQTEDFLWWLKGLQLKSVDELTGRLQGENIPETEIANIYATVKVMSLEKNALSAVKDLHALVSEILK